MKLPPVSGYFVPVLSKWPLTQTFVLAKKMHYVKTSLLRRPRGKRRPAITCMRMRVMLTVQSLVHDKLGHREG